MSVDEFLNGRLPCSQLEIELVEYAEELSNKIEILEDFVADVTEAIQAARDNNLTGNGDE